MRLRDCAPKGVRGQFLDSLLNTADAVKTKHSLGLLFTRDLVNASEPAVDTKYDGRAGIMLAEEVDGFLADFLKHGAFVLTASVQRNVHGEVVDENHRGHQAVVAIMTGEFFVFVVPVNVDRGAVDVDPEDVWILWSVMHEQVSLRLLHGRQRAALQRVFEVAERRVAGCGAHSSLRQAKGRDHRRWYRGHSGLPCRSKCWQDVG